MRRLGRISSLDALDPYGAYGIENQQSGPPVALHRPAHCGEGEMEAQSDVICVAENNLEPGVLTLWCLDLQPVHVHLEETLEMPNQFVLQRRKPRVDIKSLEFMYLVSGIARLRTSFHECISTVLHSMWNVLK